MTRTREAQATQGLLSRIRIRRDVVEPVHRQITRQLQNFIASGFIAPNTRLPGQHELARELDIHRLTVGRAYTELEREGLVVSQKGRGSFVSDRGSASPRKTTVSLGIPNPDEWKVSPVNAFYVYECIAGIEEGLRERNVELKVVIIPSGSIEDQLANWERQIVEQQAAVFVSSQYRPLALRLVRRGFPCVICQTGVEPIEGVSFVSYDRRAAYAMVTEYLIQRGRKRIGFFGVREDGSRPNPRFLGYLDALERHGLVYDPKLRIDVQGVETVRGMYEAARAAVRAGRFGDALLCSGHGMGPAALDALHEAHIEVPRQVAVMGTDDFDQTGRTQPKLTTLYVPRREMGRASAELVMERLADPHREPVARWVNARLEEGGSA